MSAPQIRQRDPRSADTGSRTMTITPTEAGEAGPSTRREAPVGVLRLRGAPSRRPKVQFTEETIDNEGMGKKKSKICCIYHKPRAFDESSSESSASDDDDRPSRKAYPKGKGHALKKRDGAGGHAEESSESESSESEGGGGDGSARPARPKRKTHRQPHAHDCDHGPHGSSSHDNGKANKYDAPPKSGGTAKAS